MRKQECQSHLTGNRGGKFNLSRTLVDRSSVLRDYQGINRNGLMPWTKRRRKKALWRKDEWWCKIYLLIDMSYYRRA